MKNLIIILILICGTSLKAQEVLEIEGTLIQIQVIPYGYCTDMDLANFVLSFQTNQGVTQINQKFPISLKHKKKKSTKIIAMTGSYKDNQVSLPTDHLGHFYKGDDLPINVLKVKGKYKLKFVKVCLNEILNHSSVYRYCANYSEGVCEGFTMKANNTNLCGRISIDFSFFDKDEKIYLLVGFQKL